MSLDVAAVAADSAFVCYLYQNTDSVDSLINLQVDVNNTSNNTVWQSKANSCKFRNRTMSLDVAAVAADSAFVCYLYQNADSVDSLINLQVDVNNTSNNTVWQSKANSCKFRNRTMSLDVAAVAADSVSLYAIKTPTRWIA